MTHIIIAYSAFFVLRSVSRDLFTFGQNVKVSLLFTWKGSQIKVLYLVENLTNSVCLLLVGKII